MKDTDQLPLFAKTEDLSGSSYGISIPGMPDLPSSIMDREGYSVDLTIDRWSVFGGYTGISWKSFDAVPAKYKRAIALYVVDQIKFLSAKTAENSANRLQKISSILKNHKHSISSSIVREVGELCKAEGILNYMNYESDVRRWYIWCTDMGFPGFDPEEADKLADLIIGNNAKGVAVLSQDPNEGPITDVDFIALTDKLRDQATSQTPILTLQEQCVVWLLIALGSNPRNIAFLNEEDLRVELDDQDDNSVYTLSIPRIKKRGRGIREEVKERKIAPFLGRMLEELIGHNKKIREHFDVWEKQDFHKPLLMRSEPSKWLETDASQFAWHFDARELTTIVRTACHKLDVRTSVDPNVPLHVTPRRLRYTFATRLVNDGASPQQVAEALDHSDLQNVHIYFDVRSEMVRHLDRANTQLIAVAQMFLGKLVAHESEAERGDDPASRIYPPAAARLAKPVGSCGSFGYCGLYAPLACYTCSNFRPWKEGPHQAVFDVLMDERERKLEAGADPKNTQINDNTIRAIAHVVELCKREAAGAP
ncbi:MAG: site-specific integrase [Alphaproteobacteria bacterium]|nr:site-specific integrase [Alphaproteobacteria bacterium]